MTEHDPMPAHAIAIVGMALRVPGASTLDRFWHNLRNGVESIATLTDAELLADGAQPDEIVLPNYVRARGVLDDVEGFDARFFGFAPREAQMLDPQQRLFLECAWEALEHAGCTSDAFGPVTAVYAGVGWSSYLLHNLLANEDLVRRIGLFQVSLGNDKDFVPTRVSYALNLRGPSVSIQTACSTSLVAVHMACQALINGECDVALAGGASIFVPQRRGYLYDPGGILSPDGHCRAFDAKAAGTVPGSGVGVVVLKRLADAVASGDVIHGVIRGSAVNNDGALKVGFTAPSVEGQADVIAEALAVADVDAATISYVEAHGTATLLGDPIEVAALKRAFAQRGGRCALGSVKTNVGHLDTAAGVVGLIKVALSLAARELPPSLHFERPNPRLELEAGPFHVNTTLVPWRGEVLRAGVSSFGIGGTNAHVVLESAPARKAAPAVRQRHVLPISAATPSALASTARALAAHLERHSEAELADVAFTLQRGRSRLPYRRFVVSASVADAAAALAAPAPPRHLAHDTEKARSVAFLFPGQGTQACNMGRALYEREPLFRSQVDHVAELMTPHLGRDIRPLLYPAPNEHLAANELIHQTVYAQAALFAVEHALACLWMSWGVHPTALLGHSIGELVAACLAGVFSIERASRIVVARGQHMQAAPAGAMLAVPLSVAELAPLLGPLSLAAVNGPAQCVVAGPFSACADFEARLAERGCAVKRLKTSRAFHSSLMDGAARAFEAELASASLGRPQLPFVSNVTGTWITAEQAQDPAYWASQLRSTVRFADGLAEVRRSGALQLEVGPGQVLTGLARTAGEGPGALASLPSVNADGDAEIDVLTAVGELHCRGASIDWESLHAPAAPRRTVLPTYPFERRRCWVDVPQVTDRGRELGSGELAARSVRRLGPVVSRRASAGTSWLVLLDRAGLLRHCAEALRSAGARVVAARLGEAGKEQDDFARLLCRELCAQERLDGVVIGEWLSADSAEQDVDRDPDGVVLALGTLQRALDERGDARARLVAVTSGVFDVTGDELLVPRRALLRAWPLGAKPGARTLVDVSALTGPDAARRLAAALLGEIEAESSAPVVGLRGGHRFVPALERLPAGGAAPGAQHGGKLYALLGDVALASVFGPALCGAGAALCEPARLETAPLPSTLLVLLDARAPEALTLQALEQARSFVLGARPGSIHACEVHLMGDSSVDASASPLAGVVEASVALANRSSALPWTSVAWPRCDVTALAAAVAKYVCAAPGGCNVIVTPFAAVDAAVDTAETNDAAAAGAPPVYEDETERAVAAIFSDLLGVPHIEPATSFFELGGHSLLAAQLITAVRQKFELEVPLRAFIEEPTIGGLSRAVRAASATEDAAPFEALPSITPDRAGLSTPFPLTDVQQAYWIGRTGLFQIGNIGIHGYQEIDIIDLDLPRLERAFRRLIARHGMLRAIVLPQGEQQILSEVPDYVISVEDLREVPSDRAQLALDRVRATMSHQVFAPDRWPLFELRASLLEGGRTRLHFGIDGLITDAWAYHIVSGELAQLYAQPSLDLPALELSFRDYVLAERSLASSARYARCVEYWQRRIPSLALAPELPLACDPASIQAPRFQRFAGRLPKEQWAQIKAWAARRRVTPSAVLLAVYAEVLATWAKHRCFTLNLPLANRLPLHPQVGAIVGDFTSVTLLEVDARRVSTFEGLAGAVRDRLLSDLDHRLFSGVRVLREIGRVRGPAAAQMPVVFTSLFLDIGEAEESAPIGEVGFAISQTPQVWLDEQVYEVGGDLAVDIDAVEGLFPAGLLPSMLEATLQLLRWLAADEAHWGEPMPSLVPPDDLAARLAFNRTTAPIPEGLLHDPFFASAAQMPDRPAVITPSRTLSYAQLAAHARAVAARLRELDVRPNTLVAVFMEKGWEQCAAVLGILEAGAAYLPVDPELPDERVRLLLDHAQVRHVLTQSRFANTARLQTRTVLSVDTLPLDGRDDSRLTLALRARPNDLAYVIFTSGSTGTPKGVMIDHRGALNTVLSVNERFAVSAADRVLALSSLSFDLSVFDIFGPLAAGGAVVMVDAKAQRDPAAWRALMDRAEVTIWNSVPALMELLLEHESLEDSASTALRLVLLSGDWIGVGSPERIRHRFGAPEIVSLGGATEASIWSIYFPIGAVPSEWTSIPYGRPLPNQTIHVLDEQLHPRPTLAVGQLYIGGIGVALGYLHDETKTAARFIVHPLTGERIYHTGDLGRFLPSGDVEFLGREDSQVKVQGHRIELGEIEAALAQHPALRAAVVIARGEHRGTKQLVAFVVPSAGQEVPDDVREFLRSKLPEYMVPGIYVALDALPLTANGKVDRRALVLPDEALEDSTRPHEPPRTPLEGSVAAIWSTVLGVERVGIQDNFFVLGGDSLMAMRAVVHLRKAFDVDIPIRILFDNPTLEACALVVHDQLLAKIEALSEEEAAALPLA